VTRGIPGSRPSAAAGCQAWAGGWLQLREFDDLLGAGKPIPGLDKPHDDLWWVKQELLREEVSFLPSSLAIRKDVEDTLAVVGAMGSEAEIRKAVEHLNARIRNVNRTATSGPPSTTMPLDVETVVAGWRSRP
jgi:hypothetical protein